MFVITFFSILFVGASASVIPSHIRANGRIFGGTETTIEEHPYAVSLQANIITLYIHYCGGSILSRNYVLSAAGCTMSTSGPTLVMARVGTTKALTGGQAIKVTKFTYPPSFNTDTYDYDVNVLTLLTPLTLGEKVVPVVLPSSADPEEGEMATAIGWGVTNEAETEMSKTLMKVDLPVWSNDKCKDVYPFLTPRHICLGGNMQTGGACFGDEGGPAMYNGVQIGIVTEAYGCSSTHTPGLYTRVSKHLDWIRDKAHLN